MSDSPTSAVHEFWEQVEQQLAHKLYSRAEARWMTLAYRSRIEDVSDLDLVYHQGVDATVMAIASGGFETNPQQFLEVDLWAEYPHLRGYLAKESGV